MKNKKYIALLSVCAILIVTICTSCSSIDPAVSTNNSQTFSPSDSKTKSSGCLTYSPIPEYSELSRIDSVEVIPYGMFTVGEYIERGIICMRLEEFKDYGGFYRGETYTGKKSIEVESFEKLAYKLLDSDFTDEEVEIIDRYFMRYQQHPFVYVPNPYTLLEFEATFPEHWQQPVYTWNQWNCHIRFGNMSLVYQYPQPIMDNDVNNDKSIIPLIDELVNELNDGALREGYESIEYNGLPAFRTFTNNRTYYYQKYIQNGQTYYLCVSEYKGEIDQLYWYTNWNDIKLAMEIESEEFTENFRDITDIYDIRIGSNKQ